MKALLALPLLALLGGCVTTGEGSVTGGECKIFTAPQYAIRGARSYDQDWIDSTVEGGVGGCKWKRPAARPASLDTKPAHKAKAAPLPKPKPLWLQMLRSAPVAPVAAPEPLTVLPAEPDAPAPRSVIDELLHPSDAK